MLLHQERDPVAPMAQPRRHVVGECAGGVQGYFWSRFRRFLSINPKVGALAKSTQPIGLLFGPGSGESGRDVDTCRIALRQVGSSTPSHVQPVQAGACDTASVFYATNASFSRSNELNLLLRNEGIVMTRVISRLSTR